MAKELSIASVRHHIRFGVRVEGFTKGKDGDHQNSQEGDSRDSGSLDHFNHPTNAKEYCNEIEERGPTIIFIRDLPKFKKSCLNKLDTYF